MIETITLTSIGGVAVAFMLTFFSALRRDARKPHVQPIRRRVLNRTLSISENEPSPALCRAA
jgi:hypothetical protein